MPCWVTVNCASPFTVTVPDLPCELGFAATVIPIVDGLAVPPPNEIVIHGTSETADFRQEAGVPDAESVVLSTTALAAKEVGVSTTAVQVCPNPICPARHTPSPARITRKGIRVLKHSL